MISLLPPLSLKQKVVPHTNQTKKRSTHHQLGKSCLAYIDIYQTLHPHPSIRFSVFVVGLSLTTSSDRSPSLPLIHRPHERSLCLCLSIARSTSYQKLSDATLALPPPPRFKLSVLYLSIDPPDDPCPSILLFFRGRLRFPFLFLFWCWSRLYSSCFIVSFSRSVLSLLLPASFRNQTKKNHNN